MPGRPQAEGQTLTDLKKAIKIASYEYALYDMYARMAASQAHPYVAVIFHELSKTEAQHSVPLLTDLAGAVSPSVAQNLASSVGTERNAHNRYVSQAQLAERLGDATIARQLYYNGYMEQHHGDAYRTLLDAEEKPARTVRR